MKIFSQLEKAQLELLGADPTGTGLITGRAWFRTDTTKMKVYDGTVIREYVDLNSSQSLSTKTLADPTITGAILGTQIATPANPSAGFNKLYPKADNMMYFLNSAGVEKVLIDGSSTQSMSGKSLTDPTMLASIIGTQIATPSAPSSGFNKLYPKSDGKWYNQTSAGVETELGAGGGGGINYITFPSGDTGVGTWVISKNTSANAVPDNGFVTSGITGTFATTGTAPHRGTASFLWTLGALGEQIYIPFTIDNEDKGKVLQGSLSYSIVSGTYADNIHAYIYDVTNAVFIQPAPFKLLNSGIIEKFGFEFQTSYNSTSYRLVLHQAVAGTPAVKLDSFSVGPQAKLYGPNIFDLGTETWADSEGNCTTSVELTRVGDRIFVTGKCSATGAFGGATFDITVPAKYQAVSQSLISFIGRAHLADTGTQDYNGVVQLTSATNIRIYSEAVGGTYGIVDNVTGSAPFTWAAGDFIYFEASWIVSGWEASSQMSNDANTRAVDFKVASSQAYAFGNGVYTLVDYNSTATVDTHGGWQAGGNTDKYVIQVPGDYLVGVMFETAAFASGTANRSSAVGVFKNGVNVDNVAYIRSMTTSSCTKVANGTTLLPGLKAGDIIDMRAYNDDSPVTGSGSPSNNYFWLKKISGPAQIQASETITARYSTAAGQSIPNATDTIVDFGTKTFDTHGTVTTGASWKFIAQRHDFYKVSALIGWSTLNTALIYRIKIFKNGVIYSQFTSEGDVYSYPINDVVELNAGEYIDVRVNQVTGGSVALEAAADRNYITITAEG